MRFPLELHFHVLSFGDKINLTDADGKELLYISEKVLTRFEDLTMYADASAVDIRYRVRSIGAGGVSSGYMFLDPNNHRVGGMQWENGFLDWSKQFMVTDGKGHTLLHTAEEGSRQEWLDFALEMLPGGTAVEGLLYTPTFAFTLPSGQVALRLHKRASLFETHYTLDKLCALEHTEEVLGVLAAVILSIIVRRVH